MKLLVAATLLASFCPALAQERRQPQFSILPADGFEGIVEGAFSRLWEGVKDGAEWVEQLWSTDDEVTGGEVGVEEQEVEEANEWRKKKTVYQILSEKDEFSKLLFLISQDPESVTYLSTSGSNFTLFAPTNAAFPAPHKHQLPLEFGNPFSLETLHRYFSRHPDGTGWIHSAAVKVLHALLQYHLLPGAAYPFTALAENSTAATALSVPGALLGAPQRIKLTPALRPFPTLQLNFAGQVTAPDIWGSNGVVHGVSAALQPGLSVGDELYAVPWLFPFTKSEAPWVLSITASALAKTGLNSVVSHKPVFHRSAVPAAAEGSEEDDLARAEEQWLELAAASLSPSSSEAQAPKLSWTGSPAVTVFAPTNKAWARLPPRLSKWLHSPWGEFALKKLLEFHIVNGTVVFSDYVHPSLTHFATHVEQGDEGEEAAMWPKYDFDARLPTLLGKNFSLPVHVSKRPVFPLPPHGKGREVAAYHMWANGIPVAILDVPARNGAIQVVERVLNPLKGHGKKGKGKRACDGMVEGDASEEDEDEWEGWEDWFVKWAMDA